MHTTKYSPINARSNARGILLVRENEEEHLELRELNGDIMREQKKMIWGKNRENSRIIWEKFVKFANYSDLIRSKLGQPNNSVFGSA